MDWCLQYGSASYPGDIRKHLRLRGAFLRFAAEIPRQEHRSGGDRYRLWCTQGGNRGDVCPRSRRRELRLIESKFIR